MFTELMLPKSCGRLRPPCADDLESLVHHANNPRLTRWVVDAFPQPYTEAHGREFLRRSMTDREERLFAIEVEGQLAGVLGLRPGSHERRFVSGLGYWLAEPFWGRGITSEAVRVATDFLLHELGFLRIESDVYEPNAASARVLEKAGFALESRKRQAVVKHGKVLDCLHFAKIRE